MSEELSQLKPPKPAGIWILSLLHLAGGIFLTGFMVLNMSTVNAAGDALNYIGIPPELVIAAFLLIGLITVASGVGMVAGKAWGWWLGAFYYVYSVYRSIFALGMTITLADELAESSGDVERYVAKFAGRIVIHGLIFLYFYKANVLEHFGLTEINKMTAFGKLVGACLSITAVMAIASLVV